MVSSPRGANWWGEADSNRRRLSHQIYSLTPLAARESPRVMLDVRSERRRDRFHPTRGRPRSGGGTLPAPCHPQRGLVITERSATRAATSSSRCPGVAADGASGGIRTHDHLITNQVLYQLSYAGVRPSSPSVRVAPPDRGPLEAHGRRSERDRIRLGPPASSIVFSRPSRKDPRV